MVIPFQYLHGILLLSKNSNEMRVFSIRALSFFGEQETVSCGIINYGYRKKAKNRKVNWQEKSEESFDDGKTCSKTTMIS